MDQYPPVDQELGFQPSVTSLPLHTDRLQVPNAYISTIPVVVEGEEVAPEGTGVGLAKGQDPMKDQEWVTEEKAPQG